MLAAGQSSVAEGAAVLALVNMRHSVPLQYTKPAEFKPAVPVLNTTRPVAGLGMVVWSVDEVNATRGSKVPLLLDETSKMADAAGLAVPTPTDCAMASEPRPSKA